MSSFPNAVISELVENLVCEETLYLRTAALVCRKFRNEAQRVLFRSPFVISFSGDEPENERFLYTVVASPNRLALLVRRYRQRNYWSYPEYDDFDSEPDADTEDAYEARIARVVRKTNAALRVMTGLTHLTLLGMNVARLPPGVRFTDILRGCTFSLKAFYWLHPSDDQLIIHDFLRTQPALRHLGLYGLRPPFLQGGDMEVIKKAAKEVCPRLESLHMPLETAVLFLPGRKLKGIWWTSQYESVGMDIRAPSMQPFATELATVEYMDCDEVGDNPPLALLANYLPSLRVLKTNFRSKKETAPLAKLPSLEVLILTREFDQAPLGQDILQAVFFHCKKLKYVDAQSSDWGFFRIFEAPKTKISLSTAPRVSFLISHAWHDTAFGMEHLEIDGYE